MQEITLVTLEEWREMTNVSDFIITGPPCEELMALQQSGYPVLAELTHLQGLSEEAVAEVLCKEEAIREFTNVCIHARELPQGYLRRIWCKNQGEPVLIAETERLLIRESIAEDAEAFYELYQDEACRKYLERPPVEECSNRAQNIKEYERYIVDYQKGQYGFYEYGMWSVVEKESGRCVGRAGVELQSWGEDGKEQLSGMEACGLCLGYALLPEVRGKGYATEACRVVLEYCWECGYGECLVVKIKKENASSLSLYKRLKKQSPMTLQLFEV